MEITNSTSSVQGMMNAFAKNAARGKRLADPENDPQFEKDMAELPTDKQEVGVNSKVIKTKDQMLGTLLDMVA
jgi:hypothetical protein